MDNLNSGLSPLYTSGEFIDEDSSKKYFDEIISSTGLFEIWGIGTSKGITGQMIHPLPGMDNRNHYFIDRILSPTEKLRKSGWTKGLIGVELKKSGLKAGPPLSQMLDYMRCAWNGPGNIKVLIEYCFLWPLDKCGATVASIMAQNRIGGVMVKYPPTNAYHRLQFSLGEQFIIFHYINNNVTEVKNLETGKNTGSR